MHYILNPLTKSNYPAQTAAYTGTAGNTAGWAPGADSVLVWSDQACYVEVGEGAVATTASTPIPANTPVRLKVPVTTTGLWRVSAIQVATGGTVYCKPLNSV